MVTYHPQDGHPPSPGGSLTIRSLVIHQSRKSRQASSGWSPTNSRMVPTNSLDCYRFPRTVTRHLQDGQLDIEFDSCAAQLVNLVVSQAQIVSTSVALRAKLVFTPPLNARDPTWMFFKPPLKLISQV